MKLTAMQDQWEQSEDAERSAEDRSSSRAQAIKHAKDVCRIVAMVTRDESDTAATVLDAIRVTPPFAKAVKICTKFFAPEDGWGVMATQPAWEPTDLQLIRETLARWFVKPEEMSQS